MKQLSALAALCALTAVFPPAHAEVEDVWGDMRLPPLDSGAADG